MNKSKYMKTNKMEVLKAFNSIEVINAETCRFMPTSRRVVAYHLKTSLYQVNKYCRELIKEGILRVRRLECFHDYDYEYGIDYGNSLSIPVTEITDKGFKMLKELKEE